MMLTDMVNVLMVSTTIHLEIELVGAIARMVALGSEGTARNGKGAPGGAPLSAELASSIKVVARRRSQRYLHGLVSRIPILNRPFTAGTEVQIP